MSYQQLYRYLKLAPWGHLEQELDQFVDLQAVELMVVGLQTQNIWSPSSRTGNHIRGELERELYVLSVKTCAYDDFRYERELLIHHQGQLRGLS